MIYLDNSATTAIKPKSVITNVVKGLTNLSANPGRSGHKASLAAAIKVGEVREKICKMFGVGTPENVIFTLNCTDALNLAILGTAKEGGHVIATAFEHNSTLRPLFELERKGIISVSIVNPKDPSKITKEDIAPLIRPNTYMVCTIHISNVDGAETEVEEIGSLCKKHKLIYLVDAAQSGGHKVINMQKQNISLLALAGHKGLFGPMGIGVLAIGPDVLVNPIRFGGTGTSSSNLLQPSEIPERYESGTIALPNILGLGAGIDFVSKNQHEIEKKIKYLTKFMINELKNIKNVKVYTSLDNLNGVVAFNISNIDSTIVSEYLNDKFEICVRSGLHCAPLKHEYLGTKEQGIIRASLSYFSTEEDVRALIYGIKDFIKSFDL